MNKAGFDIMDSNIHFEGMSKKKKTTAKMYRHEQQRQTNHTSPQTLKTWSNLQSHVLVQAEND